MEKLGRVIDKVMEKAIAVLVILCGFLLITAPSEPVVHAYCSKKFGDLNITEVVMCIKDSSIWGKVSYWISDLFFSSIENVLAMTMADWGHVFYLILIFFPAMILSLIFFYFGSQRLHTISLFPETKYTEDKFVSNRNPFSIYLLVKGFIVFYVEYPKRTNLLDGEESYFYVFGIWIMLVGIGLLLAKKLWGKEGVKEQEY